MATSKRGEATADEPALVEDDSRPMILAFFERVGLVKGGRFKTVVMTSAAGRSYIGPVVVQDIAAIGNGDDVVPSEIVISFSEPGLSVLHRVRYSQLVCWSQTPED